MTSHYRQARHRLGPRPQNRHFKWEIMTGETPQASGALQVSSTPTRQIEEN
jgi:hypothetical protein